MTNTLEIFADRKSEIEFYFSVILDYNDNNTKVINTIDNKKFFRIMKSNFILMLYNLVESTITNGFEEIYEDLKSNNCTYNELIKEIQNIWRENKIREIYKPETILKTYTNRVENIVNDIINEVPITLHKGMINISISGNLNAKSIKDICNKHHIRYTVIDDKNILDNVKNNRNALAHGDVSFSKCSRDLTINDLENTKDTVINFLEGILKGMKEYCDGKKYRKDSI